MKKNKKDLLFLFLLFFSFYAMFNKELNLFVEGNIKQLVFVNYYKGLKYLQELNKEFKTFREEELLNLEEKENLKEELQIVKEQYSTLHSNYNKVVFENNLLKTQQNITQNHYERNPIATFKVIYFVKGAKYFLYAKIDEPKQKNFLKPKMPVYSNGFLVGNINKIFSNTIEINFINSVNFQIPFIAKTSKIRGLLNGKNSDKIGLNFLYYKKNISFKENELLLTSDKFASIPEFIPIAIIKFNKQKVPYALPILDIDKITYVSVINFKG